MHWQLWDTESANLVETFATEAEALQGVRELLAVNRPDLIDELVLGAMYDEGESHEIELPPVLDGEALKSRLAIIEQSSVADIVRQVHEKIRRWLTEEGWSIREMPDPQASFKVQVTLQDGKAVHILQDHDHRDHITIVQHWAFPKEFQDNFAKIPVNMQRIIVLDVYRTVQVTGIDMDLLGVPPTDMRYLAYIYFDGISKDVLIQRILSVLRAYALSMRTIARGFEEAGSPQGAAASVLHLVPPVRGPLTAAS